MPRPSYGSIWKNAAGHWYFRVRLTPAGKRHALPLPAGFGEPEARKREKVLRALVAKVRAGAAPPEGSLTYLQAVAAADERSELRATTDAIRYAKGELGAPLSESSTFAQVAEEWTSGRLAVVYPDHVNPVREDDSRRVYLTNHILPVIGHVPVDRFDLDHAFQVLASLPTSFEQSTRNAIAGTVGRVLLLARFPLRLIKHDPLPRNWIPKLGARPGRPYLRPAEDAQFLACPDVPLTRRILFGFLDREGARISEAKRMTWDDFDLHIGSVTLDKNKTNDPRAWALGADVVRALLAWKNVLARMLGRAVRGSDPVFVKVDGKALGRQRAEEFRDYLLRAGVGRRELHENGANWKRARIHELRATFITLALATGRTETWVADRTGHKSSNMINLYRRAARMAAELGLGWLLPLDEAIPELRGAVGENVKPLRARGAG